MKQSRFISQNEKIPVQEREINASLSDDDRIQIMANLIVDRISDDRENGVLKFTDIRRNLDVKSDNDLKLDGMLNENGKCN